MDTTNYQRRDYLPTAICETPVKEIPDETLQQQTGLEPAGTTVLEQVDDTLQESWP